jgi:hypothetical protein
MSSTPQHCPGFQSFKDLKSFLCACPECGKEKEIFSDEFDRPTHAAIVMPRLILPNVNLKDRQVPVSRHRRLSGNLKNQLDNKRRSSSP